MGRIKCRLCFLKKAGQKSIFAPKIALRVERSDPARNSFFPADFLSAHLQCSQLLWNFATIKLVYRKVRGDWGLDIAQTIVLNCSMTHSPGKLEYNCRYFIMTFRTQIHKKKFGKKCFCTLQGSVADPGCLCRIPDPDFYPSRIPDPGSRIPDPKTGRKERGEKKIFVKHFFVATNFTKCKII